MLDFVVLFKLKYISGSCCWKVRVGFSVINDANTQWIHALGNYRKESTLCNGKPHYTSYGASGANAIWYEPTEPSGWMIGSSSERGSTTGYAYNPNNYNCPYDAAYDWKYYNRYGNWADAGKGLSIWNQC